MTDSEVSVRRSDQNQRYEVWTGGELAGFTEFHPDAEGRLVFPETLIVPSFRGRGLAGILVAGAMADAAARGDTVVPRCPVVVRYLRGNEVAGLSVHWHERSGEQE